MLKRIFTIIMVLVLGTCLIPFNVFAVEQTEDFKIFCLPIKSNVTDADTINAYCKQEECFFAVSDICELTRSEYDINNNSIKISQGIFTIEINIEENILCVGNESTEFIVEEYDGEYLVKPYALLKLLCANCVYDDEKNLLFILMPVITTYEALAEINIAEIYYNVFEDESTDVYLRMTCAIIMDTCFGGLGNFFTKDASEWFEAALLEITKVDIYEYSELESKISNTTDEQLKINIILTETYNIETKSIDTLNQLAEKIKLKELDTLLENYDKLKGFGDNFVFFYNIVNTTQNKINYNMDSYELFSRTLTADNLKNVPGDFSTIVGSAEKVSNEINSALSAFYSASSEEIQKRLFEKAIDSSIKFIDTVNESQSASQFVLAYDIGVGVTKILMHDKFEAYSADLNAVFLSGLQYDFSIPISYMYENISDGFWNIENTKQFIDMISLYDRTSIAMFSNLKKSNKEFGGYDSNKLDSLCNKAAQWEYNLYFCDPERDICSLEDFRTYYSNDITKSINLNDCDEYIEFDNWHLEPSIEAEDIIVIDNKAYFLEEGYMSPYDECAIIKQNEKYGIIKYDGSKITEPIYENGCYDIQGAVSVYNDYDQTKTVERVDIFSEKGGLRIQKNLERGWGYQGSEYLWINNKVTDMSGTLFFSGKYYDESYNVVVKSAQLDSNERFVNISDKYGIANKNTLLVPIEYDMAYMHSYNNVIALQKNEKWTYFNESGISILENCEGFDSNKCVIDWWEGGGYDYNESYILPYIPTENYIPVKINGKCGYYNTDGEEVIPCGTFEDVRPVHNGLAWVKKDGLWGVIKLEKIENETPKTSYDEKDDLILSDYSGTYYSINSDWNIVMNLQVNNDNYADINITITNSTGTKVSENVFSGNIMGNVLSFTSDDGFGENEFNLEFKDGYISLSGKCLNSYGTWGIPEINQVEMRKDGNPVVSEFTTTGTVTTEEDRLNVRQAPSTEAEIIGKLEKGSTVTIISEADGWYEIEYNSGLGFVSAEFIKLNSETPEPTEQIANTSVSDNAILNAVNRYFEENQNNIHWKLEGETPYCPSEHMYSNDTNWSCPINLSYDSYSDNEIGGAYPHFTFVDKVTMQCTIMIDYDTVAEFDLNTYL